MSQERRTCLILGAGWSAAAGLPLASDLIQGPIYVASDGALMRANAVLAAWRHWIGRYPNGTAEPFLADVEAGTVTIPSPRGAEGIIPFPVAIEEPLPWSWAVELVAMRLAYPVRVPRGDPRRDVALRFPRHTNTLRYGGNLSLAPRAPLLRSFLRSQLAGGRIVSVITTNYDTLAERLLRPNPMDNAQEPGFIYGGLPVPQYAHGHLPWDHADPRFADRRGELPVRGGVPVFKLHGSLNWSRSGSEIEIFRDQRSAFRCGGNAAIVAPTPEKVTPDWLRPIWAGAEESLRSANRWVVVGYSLPEYDYAARDFFAAASAGRNDLDIEVHDPQTDVIRARWRSVCGIEAHGRPGI